MCKLVAETDLPVCRLGPADEDDYEISWADECIDMVASWEASGLKCEDEFMSVPESTFRSAVLKLPDGDFKNILVSNAVVELPYTSMCDVCMKECKPRCDCAKDLALPADAAVASLFFGG